MDKNKREQIKTMILFCLMFFGINYALYTFVMVPKTLVIEEVQQVFYEVDANKSMYEMKEEEKVYLSDQIAEKKVIEVAYNELVMEQFDTINMTVDFYDFMKALDIEGQYVRYDLTDIVEGIEAESLTEEAIISEDEPGYDPSLVVEQLNNDDEKVLYRTANIELEIKMAKNQLNKFLVQLEDISKQNTYIKTITINTESESAQNESEETQSLVDSNPDSAIDQNDVDNESIDESGMIKEEYLLVTLLIESFVKDKGTLDISYVEYTFYEGITNHEDLSDLFGIPAEN